MTRPVLLDASALLAAIFAEPGAQAVEAHIGNARISAVNGAEVIGKLVDRGMSEQAAQAVFDALLLPVEPFTARDGAAAGGLRAATRGAGLSLGDRCCLAAARERGLPAVTADRAWARLGPELGVQIEVIR